jgi:hypothetical protein
MTNVPFPSIAKSLADSAHALSRAGENKVLKEVLVVAHAMGGVVVDANGKQVCIKPSLGRGAARTICLKGKVAA